MQNSGYQLKTAQDSILSFYLSHPLRSVLYTLSHARHSHWHGLPESRLQGCIKITIHGAGYRLPGRYDELLVYSYELIN